MLKGNRWVFVERRAGDSLGPFVDQVSQVLLFTIADGNRTVDLDLFD